MAGSCACGSRPCRRARWRLRSCSSRTRRPRFLAHSSPGAPPAGQPCPPAAGPLGPRVFGRGCPVGAGPAGPALCGPSASEQARDGGCPGAGRGGGRRGRPPRAHRGARPGEAPVDRTAGDRERGPCGLDHLRPRGARRARPAPGSAGLRRLPPAGCGGAEVEQSRLWSWGANGVADA